MKKKIKKRQRLVVLYEILMDEKNWKKTLGYSHIYFKTFKSLEKIQTFMAQTNMKDSLASITIYTHLAYIQNILNCMYLTLNQLSYL